MAQVDPLQDVAGVVVFPQVGFVIGAQAAAELQAVAGVQREGMRDCMSANKAKFSATCQAAMDAGSEGRSGEGRGKRSDAPAVLPTPVSTSGAQKSTQ